MPRMVDFHPDKPGNSNCRRPGILIVADQGVPGSYLHFSLDQILAGAVVAGQNDLPGEGTRTFPEKVSNVHSPRFGVDDLRTEARLPISPIGVGCHDVGTILGD